MAKKKTPTWIIGCGIGCGALVLGALILAALGFVWTRNATKGFDEAVQDRTAIEERFGEAGKFTPPPDGAVPPGRMEVFLAVREATRPAREEIAGFLEKLPLSGEQARELDEKPFTEKFGQILDIAGSAMGMVGDLGKFLHARNQALLEAGMSMGEYSYIYSLAYYSFLGKAPGDGVGSSPGEAGRGPDRARIQVAGNRATSNLREHMEKILRNQLASIPEEDRELRESVTAELEKMGADGDYLPWLDGLPRPIELSLAPYRQRLEATYNRLTNEFELAQVQKKSAVSFTMD